MTAGRQKLGQRGEDLASRWYDEHGYTVVDRNWRCSSGELDVIASCGASIVFCEVKTRSSDRYGRPAEAVNAAKQLRIRRLAAQWLAGLTVWLPIVDTIRTQLAMSL